METVNDLKKKYGKTSEYIFDIMPQPGINCPMIDEIIKNLKRNTSDIAGHADDVERKTYDDIHDEIMDIKWYADYSCSSAVDGLEILRKDIEELRSWGNQWKDLAKELLDRVNPELRNEYINGKLLNQ